ncbi:hypothetical protein MTO96_047993 [Rhipicephalus appendiculatus]
MRVPCCLVTVTLVERESPQRTLHRAATRNFHCTKKGIRRKPRNNAKTLLFSVRLHCIALSEETGSLATPSCPSLGTAQGHPLQS